MDNWIRFENRISVVIEIGYLCYWINSNIKFKVLRGFNRNIIWIFFKKYDLNL